jgi:glycosyltransferase involved in cell wall biosynthesis
MPTHSEPLVSVVTPVHNGAGYLHECIQSVLSQTYQNWEYIIVNNGSTDDSLAIARSYAEREPRIAVYDTPQLLKATANFNFALSKLSDQSQYCKIVHADDWLFPECLSAMVKLAVAQPSVVLVSSYRLMGQRVGNDCLPYPSLVIPGREACRSFLLGKYNVFGNPSSTMIRSDVIRKRSALYEESGDVHQAADCQVCLDVLQDGDLGFVHQVLTFSRIHADSLSSAIGSFAAFYPERLHLIKQFGRSYLDQSEYDACWKHAVSSYMRALVLNMFLLKDREFWRFHRREMRKLGLRVGPIRLATEALRTTASVMARPLARFSYWRKRDALLAESKPPASVL